MANPEIDNYVTVGGEPTATKQDLEDLKDQCNSSFFEVANMFLELQSGLQQLNERIDLYNKKSSHKI
jgi:hypothetical protein